MKRLLLVAVSLVAADREVGSPEYSRKLVQFHVAYNEFFRDYFGCPKHAIDVSECVPAEGRVNYGAYLKTVKAAQRVFPK